MKRRQGEGLEVFGRLQTGVSIDQVRSEGEALTKRLVEDYPVVNRGLEFVVKPLKAEFVKRKQRITILAMFGAVIMVLLISCANIANLLIARNAARSQEFSVRIALGASRWCIVRAVLVECLVISLLGGTLAYLMAIKYGQFVMETIRSIETFAPPYWVTIEPDWRIGVFSVLIAVIAAIAAGLWPALKATRTDINSALRQGSQNLAGDPHRQMTKWLVTAQIALSCVVLICGGLMTRSVISLGSADTGAETNGFFTSRIGLFPADYPEEQDRLRFFETLIDRVSSLPEVKKATLSSSLPGTFTDYRQIQPEGIDSGESGQQSQNITVSPNYFETFGIKILAGRPFTSTDRTGSLLVVIVNQRLVEKYWPGQNPVGKRLRFKSGRDDSWLTIVGVVPNVAQDEIQEELWSAVYLPLAQNPPQSMSLAALSNQEDPMVLTEPIRKTVLSIDRDLPIYWVRTLDDWIAMGRFRTNFLASQFVIFALLGLILGGVGQYALLAYSVSLRSREFRVRRALGAKNLSVIKLLLRQNIRHLVIGLSLGFVISIGFARLLSFVLYGIEPFDVLTFSVVCLVLMVTALLSAVIPARRALAVDPMSVLRSE